MQSGIESGMIRKPCQSHVGSSLPYTFPSPLPPYENAKQRLLEALESAGNGSSLQS